MPLVVVRSEEAHLTMAEARSLELRMEPGLEMVWEAPHCQHLYSVQMRLILPALADFQYCWKIW
jgi:hypothetical protein